MDGKFVRHCVLVSIGVLCSITVWGSPEEDAAAALSLSQAVLDAGKKIAPLPDKPPQAEAPIQRETQDASDTGPKDGARAQATILPEMRLEILAPVAAEAPMKLQSSRRKATVYTARNVYGPNWCVNCGPEKQRVGNGNDQIELIWSDDVAGGPQIYPAYRFLDINGKEKYPASADLEYRKPASLAELCEIIDYQNGTYQSYAAAGPGGAIHASDQITQAFDYFRKYVGDGNRSSLVWDRNGAQLISLLANTEWSTANIFGTEGRMELRSPDAINLPIKEFAFGYRIRGSDVIIQADPVTLKGLADKLSPSQARSFGANPMGIIGIDDVLEAYWIFSMVRDICSLLWPSVDLMLPPQIATNAVLNGETLTVTFDKSPTVRIVALFTFKLVVKTVTITKSKVHVEFTGSRFIRSRDFAVK